MPVYVALLRAVNVGGTGKLAMSKLKAMCAAEGFTEAETYIASGNVVFSARPRRQRSRPGSRPGTARNMNTVAKLVELARTR
jgi:uncharacterized protein (DUF1697 family)